MPVKGLGVSPLPAGRSQGTAISPFTHGGETSVAPPRGFSGQFVARSARAHATRQTWDVRSPVILSNTERVLASISQGESHFREFKTALAGPPGEKRPRDPKAIRRDIGEALVAFANADGGELLLGVEDDGQVTGVPHSPEVVESFFDAPRTNILASTPLATPWRARVEIKGMLVLILAVDKGTRFIHQTSDGRCLQRRDRETVPIAVASIAIERRERLSREYDRAFVDGATLADLDAGLVERLINSVGTGLSAEKALQLIELSEYAAGRVRLRRAALLLFASPVQRWHPRCEVRIVRVAGTEMLSGPNYNVEEVETVTAPVLALLPDAWDALRPHLSRTVYAGGVFQSRISYPDDACLEALVNAIAHRDYSDEGRAIEVALYDDRLEVRSPGGLLSNVSLDGLRELRGVHQSRNAFVARALREAGVMREMGEGMRRIFQLLRQNDLVDPELYAGADVFTITLFHKSVYSQAAQRWLASFDRFNLSRRERQVVLLAREADRLSPNDIMSAAGISDTEDYRALVESLQLKGLLVSELSKSQINNLAVRKRRESPARARRNVPRYAIRSAPAADAYLSELVRAVRGIGGSQPLTPETIRNLQGKLSKDSPYNQATLARSLLELGIIDADRRPVIG